MAEKNVVPDQLIWIYTVQSKGIDFLKRYGPLESIKFWEKKLVDKDFPRSKLGPNISLFPIKK